MSIPIIDLHCDALWRMQQDGYHFSDAQLDVNYEKLRAGAETSGGNARRRRRAAQCCAVAASRSTDRLTMARSGATAASWLGRVEPCEPGTCFASSGGSPHRPA